MNQKNSNINDRNKQYNFSKAGKFSVQKYSYLIDKNQKINDKLLKYKTRKKLFDDFFQEEIVINPKSDDIDSYFSNEDIFNNHKSDLIHSKNKKKQKKEFQLKSSCSYLNKEKKTEIDLFKIRSKIINNKINKAFDKYKYHLLHHNESSNDLIDKKKISPSCTRYNPKLDYIYKKFIYSIPFKKMSGRQEKSLNKIKKNLSYNKIKNNENKSNSSIIKKESESKSQLNSARAPSKFNDNIIHGSINMKYQLSRKSLPIHYDFRIRSTKNDNISISESNQYEPLNKMSKTYSGFKLSKIIVNNFNLTNNKKYSKLASSSQSSLSSLTKRETKSFLNNIHNKERNIKKKEIFKIKNEYKENILKNKKIKEEIERNNLHILNKNNKNIYKNEEKVNYPRQLSYIINSKKNKPNLYRNKTCLNFNLTKVKNSSNKTHYKGINFEKMLSREYLDKINKYEEPIHPMITPNYSLVEPKSIMKVVYSKNIYNNHHEGFHGFNGDFIYDINKIFYKYNNHVPPKSFNFNKMEGRIKDDSNTFLPFFMLKLFGRNSIDNFNENSLKMNNFSNASFKEIKSCFNDKKCFNIRLQLDEIKKKENINIMEYKNKNIVDNNKPIKFNKEKKNKYWKNRLSEFYRINFDKLEKYHSFIGSKVDGITLKSYKLKCKYPNLLTKREKNIFEFNNNNV